MESARSLNMGFTGLCPIEQKSPMIERFVAKEKAEAEFRRGRGTTDIEAARIWKGMPENIRQLPLGNAFCPNCGVTSFASGYSLRMRDGFVLIEGRCAACGAEIARLCD